MVVYCLGLLKTFLNSLKRACPVILFFLLSFGFVYFVFGMQYVMIASIVTIFFQMRYKKNDNTFFRYVKLLIVGSLLIFLAYISSWNLGLSLLLNICVPFFLVFTQSSQFNPKGYFSYAMFFVFLSLMPPESTYEFFMELVVFWFCVPLLAVSIWIYVRFFLKTADLSVTLEGTLYELSELIEMLVYPEKKKELEKRFQQLIYDFHHISYHQKFFAVQTKENQIYDMVGTLIQRFSYLITDFEWQDQLDLEHILILRRISSFLRETSFQLESGPQDSLIREAQRLLDNMTIHDGRLRIFSRSVLHMIILLLKTCKEEQGVAEPIKKVNKRNFIKDIRSRLSVESFEMGFAIRLSVVMVASSLVSYIIPVTHSYWIPFNAFLLLQPSCEESSYRMKTRSIGTFIGCGIEFIIYPMLPGIEGQLLFSLVMVSLMYCSMPGTWYQPIFSTCYALTLAAMTINETTAITLRILYLGIAVAIVAVVNSLFFPIGKESRFRYNIKALFRLHNNYWDIIRNGLYANTDLSVSCGILTYFHMLYQEDIDYLDKNPSFPMRNDLYKVLLILWHMFAELEQIHYLVRTESICYDEYEEVHRIIHAIQKKLYPIIDQKDFAELKEQISFKEPEVEYVFKEYLSHAEELLDYKWCIPF